MNKISGFWQELKRRNVVRRNTVYAATAFVILEVASIIQAPLNLPEWTLTLVIILLCFGFIVSVIISWIYDISPEGGLERTRPSLIPDTEDKQLASSTWKIASYVSFVVIIALIILNVIPRSKSSKEISDFDKTIAVLPFENMSDQDEHAYFGDAMTDEIIMQLYKINQFSIRSRTSVQQYKDTRKTSPEIGQELDVNYLIEGSVQRYESQIRIRVQLIQSSTDEHLWGETYEGNWSDILAVQSKIAKEIAIGLETILTTDELEEIEHLPTDQPDAYEYYLKAKYFHNLRSREGFTKAISNYTKAISIDPDFAHAYSGIAYTSILQGIYNFQDMGDVHSVAFENAKKALKLNNELGEAHSALGLIRMIESDLPASEAEYRMSVKFNPYDADAHHGLSYVLSWLGKDEEAIEEARTALKLEPVNPNMIRGLGYTYYFNRQFELAIEEYKKCLEIDSTQVSAYQWLSWAYHSIGMQAEAISALSEYLILLKKEDLADLISGTYSRSGYKNAINLLIDISREQTISNISGYYWNSLLFALVGEKDKAFASLENYMNEEYTWRLIDLKNIPVFDSISADPRSDELFRATHK